MEKTHQEYVVTDEKHTTKTKTAKSAVALAVAALMLGAGVASAAYMDPGFVAKNWKGHRPKEMEKDMREFIFHWIPPLMVRGSRDIELEERAKAAG
ncbi:MAG: hypothetical protein ACLT47_05765 [Sutterella wadsworthensis]